MGTRLSATLEDTRSEIIKRLLVAEENHLAADLATQLQTLSDLAHFGFANFLAADEDLTLTVGATDADTALTDAREHGIAVGVTNEIARTGATEVLDRRVDVVSQGGLCREGNDGKR